MTKFERIEKTKSAISHAIKLEEKNSLIFYALRYNYYRWGIRFRNYIFITYVLHEHNV